MKRLVLTLLLMIWLTSPALAGGLILNPPPSATTKQTYTLYTGIYRGYQIWYKVTDPVVKDGVLRVMHQGKQIWVSGTWVLDPNPKAGPRK
jgi:hypothetical protein